MTRHRPAPPVILPQSIDAGDTVISRGAVVGVTLQYVPGNGMHWTRACSAGGALLILVAAGIGATQAASPLTPAHFCVAFAALVAVAWAMHPATSFAAHWRVELLTIAGPVAVYHSPSQADASRVANDLAAIIPR
jgi:hypothetical protein